MKTQHPDLFSTKVLRNLLIRSLCVYLSMLIISCSAGHREELAEYASVEEAALLADEKQIEESEKSVPADNQEGMRTALSSSAATIGKQDSSRRFIRTANICFKTKNVVQTVYAIEDITATHNGFIQYSNLRSDVNYVDNIKISKDSTLELTHYTIKNEMIIRVPNVELGAMLKDIVPWIDYLDYREIRADDVSLMLLKNQLAQKREKKGAARVENAIDNRGRRLSETIEGEEILQDKERRADEALISNFSLQDRIEYSTISLSIYQREAVKKELVPNEKNIDAYQPSFGSRLLESLKWGGSAIIEVFLFIANLWAFILCGVFIYVGIRMWKKKKKED